MQILLFTIGSAGDVHPFVGLGMALRERGHRVKILTNPHFQPLVERVGLEFVPLGTAEEFDRVREDPNLWDKRKGFETVFKLIMAGMRPAYDVLMEHYVPGETVVAASSLGFAPRCAQDKYNIPLATVHLQPAIFRSTIEPPKLPGMFMPQWYPRGLKRFVYALSDWLVIDRLVEPPLNAFRAELGLAPVRHPLRDWWHSPQRVIGLFPDWYGRPQEDWPPQTKLTGFPLYDERGVSDMPGDVAEFLAAGDPPVIFTPGSAMHHAEAFFEQSVKACVELNCRGILLSRYAGHVPANLPGNVRHVPYAPFSQLLPKVAVLVHHGGIGTSAQAMASGVKQLVVPFSHDQFDNAERMRRLGVAAAIPSKAYRTPRVAEVLKQVLGYHAMEARCREIARRFVGNNLLEQTCGLIESLNAGRPVPA
jgi:rhamnosyltransferase subunit B